MAIPKTPAAAARIQRLSQQSSQSTVTGARKRLNEGTPSHRSAPPQKKRKTASHQPQEEGISDDAALQSAIARAEDAELQPGAAGRVLRARQAPNVVTGPESDRDTPPHLRSSPPAPQSRSAAGRAIAAEEQDSDFQPGDGDNGNELEDEHPPKLPKRRPAKLTDNLPTSTPAPLSTRLPKDMTPAELQRVAGNFTREELMAMQRVVDDFGQRHNLEEAQVHNLIQARGKRPDNHTQMLRNKLAAACPGRDSQKILDKARKLFNDFVIGWTEEQDEELRDLYEKHGPMWKFIGEMLHRHEMDVRDHHRTIEKRPKNNRRDKWDSDETEQLRDKVFRAQEVIQMLRDEATVTVTRPLNDDVSWQLVADMIGGQRTAAQCRRKFEDMQDGTDHGGAASSARRKSTSKAKGKAVASSRRSQPDIRDAFVQRHPSVDLGAGRSKYKSAERVVESDSGDEVEDATMGGVENEEEVDKEIVDSRSAAIDNRTAQEAPTPPIAGDQTQDPTLYNEDGNDDDNEDGNEDGNEDDNEDDQVEEGQEVADETHHTNDEAPDPQAEANPPPADDPASSPGIKPERPSDDLAALISAVQRRGSSDSSEQDSDDEDSDSSDRNASQVKNEAPSPSSSSSNDNYSSSGEASTGEESSNEETRTSKKRPVAQTTKTPAYTQDRFTRAPTSPLQSRKSPPKISSQPTVNGFTAVNGVSSFASQPQASTQPPTSGQTMTVAASTPKNSTQPLVNGKTTSVVSKRVSTSKKVGGQRSGSKTSRKSKSEVSSDDDLDDIPDKAPPTIPASARRSKPSKRIRGLAW